MFLLTGKIWTEPPADESRLMEVKSTSISVGKISKRRQGETENILCIVRNNVLFSYCGNYWNFVIFFLYNFVRHVRDYCNLCTLYKVIDKILARITNFSPQDK